MDCDKVALCDECHGLVHSIMKSHRRPDGWYVAMWPQVPGHRDRNGIHGVHLHGPMGVSHCCIRAFTCSVVAA